MRPILSAFALSLLFAGPAAHANPDDDIDIEEDDDDDFEFEDDESTPPPIEGEDDLEDKGENEDELEDFTDPEEGEEDLLGEEEGPQIESGDDEAIYRAAEAELSRLDPDEEQAGWDEYLATYPLTPYRSRIEARQQELMDALYENKIGGGETGVDAMRQEFTFAQAMQLENINPRTRFQTGFEWGLPSYMNLLLDYEHAIARSFSVHAGVRRRFTGWNIEPGVRWAPVKSLRTKTIFAVIGDFHFNTNPAFLGIRPQLALGKRFGDTVDAQIQGGVDVEARAEAPPNFIGGASVNIAATDVVGIFADTALRMKPVPSDGAFEGGLYSFNSLTFGMKFFPEMKNADPKSLEVNLGATVPVMQRYWQWHYGSIMGQVNYYL